MTAEPNTDERFDIVVIGAGPGGYSTALRAAELGLSVALVERDATVGGTCLNRGCIPSKALIAATHTIDTVRRAAELGVNASVDGIDYGRLRDWRLHVVDTMIQGLSGLLAHRGVTVFRAVASLAAGRVVRLSASPGAGAVLRYREAGVPVAQGPSLALQAGDVVLAVGGEPLPLPGIPFHGALIDSTQALELDEFPSSAVVIGAGPIAVEFASMWHAAGSNVTMLIRKDRVLSSWNRRASTTLTRELRRQGIDVVTDTSVVSVDTGVNLGATVRYRRHGTDDAQVWGEIALAAIGRRPLTGAPWFAEAGVTLDARGLVSVDAMGRTDAEHVWAVGDVTAGHAMAHRAFEQGMTVAEAIAGLDPRPVDEDTVPQIVFSSPEAASVGMTGEQARRREDVSDVQETSYPMLGNARMLMSGTAGAMTIVSGVRADGPDVPVVLGVHLVAPVASDLIAEAEQLVGNRVPLSDAARLVHPHPTFSETLGEALLKADGRPLHTR